MRYAVYTNIGKIREENEDSYLVQMEPIPLFAVADGMGGHRAGEIASNMTVEIVEEHQFDLEGDLLEEIAKLVDKANCRIIKAGLDHEEYQGMGTTLSIGIINNQELYLGHVGDSRIYLFRDDSLEQLTTDHSLVHELLEKKEITCQEAFKHPQRHIITQALGSRVELEVETRRVSLKANDRLLFCTDGLSDMIEFKEIKQHFLAEQDINKLSDALGNKAMENGGKDNITLIICEIN